MAETFIVIARESVEEGGAGCYTLATRTVFESAHAALLYVGTISPSREPMVVPGDFENLRLHSMRGKAAHWGG
jgi:hypothetical protein